MGTGWGEDETNLAVLLAVTAVFGIEIGPPVPSRDGPVHLQVKMPGAEDILILRLWARRISDPIRASTYLGPPACSRKKRSYS